MDNTFFCASIIRGFHYLGSDTDFNISQYISCIPRNISGSKTSGISSAISFSLSAWICLWRSACLSFLCLAFSPVYFFRMIHQVTHLTLISNGLFGWEKQLMVNKIIEKKELSAVNQLLTQVKGPQRLKSLIQKALNGSSPIGSFFYAGSLGFNFFSFNI